MIYISNAFSLQMLQQDGKLDVTSCDIKEVAEKVNSLYAVSSLQFCVGHRDTAAVACSLLNKEIACSSKGWVELTVENVFRRVNVSLNSGDVLYVMQVIGGRLPEGCTELPHGIQFVWKKVVIH